MFCCVRMLLLPKTWLFRKCNEAQVVGRHHVVGALLVAIGLFVDGFAEKA